MTPKACSNCKHWLKIRKNSNWGSCQQITTDTGRYVGVPLAMIRFSDAPYPVPAQLHTHETFYCGLFALKATGSQPFAASSAQQ